LVLGDDGDFHDIGHDRQVEARAPSRVCLRCIQSRYVPEPIQIRELANCISCFLIFQENAALDCPSYFNNIIQLLLTILSILSILKAQQSRQYHWLISFSAKPLLSPMSGRCSPPPSTINKVAARETASCN
jgi:hypothetical protein